MRHIEFVLDEDEFQFIQEHWDLLQKSLAFGNLAEHIRAVKELRNRRDKRPFMVTAVIDPTREVA